MTMLSCKRVTEILASEEQLSFPRRVELAIHLAICKSCRYFKKQMFLLDRCARKWFAKRSSQDLKQVQELERRISEGLTTFPEG